MKKLDRLGYVQSVSSSDKYPTYRRVKHDNLFEPSVDKIHFSPLGGGGRVLWYDCIEKKYYKRVNMKRSEIPSKHLETVLVLGQ